MAIDELSEAEILEAHDSFGWAVAWIHEATHLDDVVFDVFVTMKQKGPVRVWEVKLLEINPLLPMTDPCLFTWIGGGKDFDGSFRFCERQD